jgi:hypothetical protein
MELARIDEHVYQLEPTTLQNEHVSVNVSL